MIVPKLSDYTHTRDGLGALPIYRVVGVENDEFLTILKPESKDGERITQFEDGKYTLQDYLNYIQAHPTQPEAKDAGDILQEISNMRD